MVGLGEIGMRGATVALPGERGGGADLCDRIAQVDMRAKEGRCAVSGPDLASSKKDCQEAMKSCSAADKRHLESAVGCWESLATCQPGRESSWADAANACLDEAYQASSECLDAF